MNHPIDLQDEDELWSTKRPIEAGGIVEDGGSVNGTATSFLSLGTNWWHLSQSYLTSNHPLEKQRKNKCETTK